MKPSKFILDANTLITPYKTYYNFDIAKGFWLNLKNYLEDGTIAMMDVVKEEVTRGQDELSSWVFDCNFGNEITRKDKEIIQIYKEVLLSIQGNPCYKSEALTEWSKGNVADAWIIAAAKKHNLTIVTFEVKNGNLNPKTPTGKAKIPDVAEEFGINCCDLFAMMRLIGMTVNG